MYKILGVVSLILFSFFGSLQEGNIDESYDSLWTKVIKFENERKPKSALEIVELIYAKAQREQERIQLTRAIFYKGKFLLQTEEQSYEAVVQLFANEIEKSPSPTKQILLSLEASLYQNYLQQNLWEISQRQRIDDFEKNNPVSWPVNTFVDKIAENYEASLAEPNETMVPLEQFNELLENYDEEDLPLMPRLYDLLALRAFDFFSNQQNYINAPNYKFTIDDPVYFAEKERFVNHQIVTKDKSSLLLRAIKLMQKHLALSDSQSELEASLNLKRLNLVYNSSRLLERESLYLARLTALEKRYRNIQSHATVLSELSNYHFNKGIRDNSSEQLQLALDYAEKCIELHPKAPETSKAVNVRNSILTKNLRIIGESVYPSEENILLHLTHTNTPKAYFELKKLTSENRDLIYNDGRQDKVFKKLKKLENIKTWEVDIPEVNKYISETSEISLDALPYGEYALLVGRDEDLYKKDRYANLLIITVSDLSIEHRKDNDDYRVFVTNRKTGAPIEGAEILSYALDYSNREDNRPNKQFKATQATDKDGSAFIKYQAREHVYVDVKNGLDFLRAQRPHRFHPTNRNKKGRQSVIFTDRAIYRPGQTVYYKVLKIKKDKMGIPSIETAQKSRIQFLDANRQEISSNEHLSNEYGTFHGSFVAPSSGLKGQMQLKVDGQTTKQIRVEEYKRPKFEIKKLPLEQLYALGDSVTLKAKAISYAGAPIDGAQVVYRVVRKVGFPWWYWGCGYRFPTPSNKSMEIANGSFLTDNEGIAKIDFVALGDDQILSKWNPMYHYTIHIDVTDSNGETQSTTEVVRIGTKSRKIAFTGNEKSFDLSNDIILPLSIQDLNNENKKGKGTIEIWTAKESSSVPRNRYWKYPDHILLDATAFAERHPQYNYEDIPTDQLRKNKKIKTLDFEHEGTEEYLLPDLEAGSYVVVAKLNEEDGSENIAIRNIHVSNFKKAEFPNVQDLNYAFKSAKNSFEPGEAAILKLGSNSKELWVLYRLERQEKLVEEKWIKVKGKESIKIPIRETDRGGLVLHLSTVYNNRLSTEKISLSVPWTNKDLKIEFESFRDKVLPGNKEKYRIKISGNQKDKVAAEMLCAMYDASLDEFVKHQWVASFYPYYGSKIRLNSESFGTASPRMILRNDRRDRLQWKGRYRRLPMLHDFGLTHGFLYRGFYKERMYGENEIFEESMDMDQITVRAYGQPKMSREAAASGNVVSADEIAALPTKNINALASTTAGISAVDAENEMSEVKPQIRTNLKETVFFFPALKTDKDGNVSFEFEMNEALTQWKMLSFAHTKDLAYAFDEKSLQTQKNIMVVPNPPRFLRDKDELFLSSKVNNLTKEKQKVKVELVLSNPINNQALISMQLNEERVQWIDIEPNSSSVVKWNIKVPERMIDLVQYQVTAIAGNHSDGEQAVLPVLTNKILLTETMPLTLKAKESKSFLFKHLSEAGGSVRHQGYTLEYTTNPAWYAVQAMPYVMGHGGRPTSIAISNKFYTNKLAGFMVQKHPKIKAVFDSWKAKDSDALLSNLEKNQELKSAILTETPWVRQAMSETQQKKNIALLFDLNQLANQELESKEALHKLQMPDGGLPWCNERRSNRYVSQNVLESLGHLQRLKVMDPNDPNWKDFIFKLVQYMDKEAKKELDKMQKSKRYLSQIAAHYLYVRSFYKEIAFQGGTQSAHATFVRLAEEHALSRGIYESAMLALALKRNKKEEAAKAITESLLERAMIHEELGMYWNEGSGFNWYELPIERHSLLIELMVEMGEDKVLDDLKLWLLKNKQTNHWKTNKATAAAIYALLIENESEGMSPWVLKGDLPLIKVGDKYLKLKGMTEEGTDYFKTSWDKNEIENSLAQIHIENKNDHVGWGAAYWQYFEDLDKVKHFEKTPLKLKKSLFKKILDDNGEKMIAISENSINIGDKIWVRIELESDRSMEYVHLKDMRASGLEPMNTLSQYKFKHGLGYYQSTGDMATDFFISYLPKGKYVFEYPLRAQHEGVFSNGITSIQSMYAPEYTSFSQGQILEINAQLVRN